MDEFLKDINIYIKMYLGKSHCIYTNDIDEAINNLEQIIIKWEDKISEEHKESFVTNDVEDKFTRFTSLCAQCIVRYKNIVMRADEDTLKRLFCRRHIGFGFYNSHVETKEFINDTHNRRYKKVLYLSLAKYYAQYYGKFIDNEQAILRLCEYYPKDNDIKIDEKEKQQIAIALYNNCKNAGEHGDTGYAFNGIRKIREGFGNLPEDVAKYVLNKYTFFDISNYTSEKRKQIYNIVNSINYTNIESDKEKVMLKFSFIDSAYVCNDLFRIFYDKYKKKYDDVVGERLDFIECSTKSIEVFKNNNIKVICDYYDENNSIKRVFKKFNIDGDSSIILAQISLEHEDDNYYMNIKIGEENMKFDYKYTDYTLNSLIDKKYYDILSNYVEINTNNRMDDTDISSYNFQDDIVFSHIWINNYRGIKNQQLSFDHNYEVELLIKEKDLDKINLKSDDNILKLDKKNEESYKWFYGENIHSLSAIVGKNGTGKTSTINFLKNEFFRLLSLIDTQEIDISNGKINMENNLKSDELCCFLVVFFLNDNPVYITNVNLDINDDEIRPYVPDIGKDRYRDSQVIYFSNMINPDVTQMEQINHSDEILFLNTIQFAKRNKNDKRNILNSFTFNMGYDFSENASFKDNYREYKKQLENPLELSTYPKEYVKPEKEDTDKNEQIFKNKSFWYQVAFLDACSEEEFNQLFDGRLSKEELIVEVLNKRLIKTDIKVKSENLLKKISKEIENIYDTSLSNSNFKFKYFSSGQYAKFSFLSKLYWYLSGYQECSSKIMNKVKSEIFDNNETIRENSTTIIFIDEGELYYHPEWQRTYIKTLLYFINMFINKSGKRNIRIQIVITSNSPFIVSDILPQDVMFIPKSKIDNSVSTFGANIHTLLMKGFFMENTIGEFAKTKIEKIIKELNEFSAKDITEQDKNKIYKEINVIGEPLIRNKLLEMLKSKLSESQNISSIDKEIERLIKIKEKLLEKKRSKND